MNRAERRALKIHGRMAANEGWGDIIVTGTRCLWWDSGAKAGRTAPFNGHSFPCCPYCGSLLLQFDNEDAFFAGADLHEAEGHPGYVAMLHWIRGKHFMSVAEAMAAWEAREL